MTCPFECEFLQEARKHDKPALFDPANLPHPEIRVSEKDMEHNQAFTAFLAHQLAQAALRLPGAADLTAREALEALVRTWKTLESGLYYESLPEDPLARQLYREVKQLVEEFRRKESERGASRTRNSDVILVLVFFQRLELDRNNGRPRSRAFLNLLWDYYGAPPPVETSSSLILP